MLNHVNSNKEMKSTLKKQYKEKLLVLNKDNNPSKFYAKDEVLDDEDDEDDEEDSSPKKRRSGKFTFYNLRVGHYD